MSQQGTENNVFRDIFRIGFGIMTAMILQNTIFRLHLFWIESFDSGVWYVGELWKQICWMSQQGTEKSVFRVIFRIGFGIMTAMILQNAISSFNSFRIERLDSGVCYFGELRKKKLLNVPARNREEHFQRNLSNWLWHYDCNDSAKYHFHIQLLSNWKFW